MVVASAADDEDADEAEGFISSTSPFGLLLPDTPLKTRSSEEG